MYSKYVKCGHVIYNGFYCVTRHILTQCRVTLPASTVKLVPEFKWINLKNIKHEDGTNSKVRILLFFICKNCIKSMLCESIVRMCVDTPISSLEILSAFQLHLVLVGEWSVNKTKISKKTELAYFKAPC